jgi:hypothetical protein
MIEYNKWVEVKTSMFKKVMLSMTPGDSIFADLHVEWNNGSAGAYLQVPTEKAAGIFEAPSAGKYLIAHIKGSYDYFRE